MLVATTVLAFVLRAFRLGYQGLWMDEVLSDFRYIRRQVPAKG